MRQTHDIKREQALAEIRDQVATGSLTIRQMTAEERARYARPDAAERAPARRRGH